MSNMTGTKACALEANCRNEGRAFIRFDYSGHGESSGVFTDGTIGEWADDAIAVLDQVSDGPQVLVGSSMGAWIMLLVALARPLRAAGLVGIASAPDFTEELLWHRFDDNTRHCLQHDGVYHLGSEFDDEPYPITIKLIEDGRRHLLLERPIAIHCPVRLLHGMRDQDVPWTNATRIAEKLLAEDVRVMIIKDGDHRLSRDHGHAVGPTADSGTRRRRRWPARRCAFGAELPESVQWRHGRVCLGAKRRGRADGV